jgi:ABC-type transport system involved in cytochrome c biogenesis ATPase subunit
MIKYWRGLAGARGLLYFRISEATDMIGHNGADKRALLRLVAGVSKPAFGKIEASWGGWP